MIPSSFINLGETNMKLRNFALTLVAAASLGAGPSLAGNSDVWLSNKTGHAIREIYLSPAGQAQWGGDRLLDSAAIESGRLILLKFGAPLACVQDLKVVFEDNDRVAVMTSLDMCAMDLLSLKLDSATRTIVALQQ